MVVLLRRRHKARWGRRRSLDPNQAIRIRGTHCAHEVSSGQGRFGERELNEKIHPMGPHHLPFYLAPGGETDVLMVVMGVFLVAALIWVGTLYLRLHSLPERMAHKSEKLQFEIVAILGLLALFTHVHIFWVAGLLLAMIDIPDFGTSLGRIATSTEKIAGIKPSESAAEPQPETAAADIKQNRETAGVLAKHGVA